MYGAKRVSFDLPLLLGIALLLIIGTTILFSVEERLFPLQFFYIFLGLLVFFLVSRLDDLILRALSPVFYSVVALLLVLTFLLGVLSNGSIRWLPIGPLTIQPSEFAKPVIVLLTAFLLERRGKYGLYISVFPFLLFLALVFIQPDFGTAIILGFAWFGTLLGSKVSFRSIFGIVFLGILSLPILWLTLAPYQRERVLSFISPTDSLGASYQSLQAMIASGSGGVFGRGLGQGSQTQLAFLPEHHTDFVFAAIGEELGFLGMSLVVLGFFVIFFRIISFMDYKEGLRSDAKFRSGVISGIFFYLFVQVFINIGMNLGILPIAGIPLPLVSAGGSALVSSMAAFGIVLALRK